MHLFVFLVSVTGTLEHLKDGMSLKLFSELPNIYNQHEFLLTCRQISDPALS